MSFLGPVLSRHLEAERWNERARVNQIALRETRGDSWFYLARNLDCIDMPLTDRLYLRT